MSHGLHIMPNVQNSAADDGDLDNEKDGIYNELDIVDEKLGKLKEAGVRALVEIFMGVDFTTAEMIVIKLDEEEQVFQLPDEVEETNGSPRREFGEDFAGPSGQGGEASAGSSGGDSGGHGRQNEAYDTSSEEFDSPSSDGTPPFNLSAMGASNTTSREDSSAGGSRDAFNAKINNATKSKPTGAARENLNQLINDMRNSIKVVKGNVAMVGWSIKKAAKMVAKCTSTNVKGVMKKAKKRVKHNCKEKITLYLTEESTLALSLITLVSFLIFLIAGAGLFVLFEGDHEETEKNEIEAERTNLLEVLLNDTFTMENTTDWLAAADGQIKEYETKLYQSFQHGVSSDTDVRVWTFWKALFFVSTITTTIGYGHIAPVTIGGRLFAIVYAVVGIPLMMIVLADLGILLARILKSIFKFIQEFDRSEMCTNANIRSLAQSCTTFFRFIFFCCGRRCNRERAPDEVAEQAVENERNTSQEDIDEFDLPIWFALIVLFIYIVFGGCLFILWEDWSLGEAFYFVFISISTIGFGDLVPENLGFMMITALYLVFGLSFTAMTIKIIQNNLRGDSDIHYYD